MNQKIIGDFMETNDVLTKSVFTNCSLYNNYSLSKVNWTIAIVINNLLEEKNS